MAGKQVTRAATLGDVADLLDSPPRVHAAYVIDGRIDAGPVAFKRVAGRYVVFPPPGLSHGDRLSILIDEGWYNSELRGVRINGTIEPIDALQPDVPGGAVELVPSSETAWDYGAMRQRSADAP